MRIGVIGLGHIGLPIANHFHALGHDVFSWTRNERNVSWANSISLNELNEFDLDFLFLASGATRPNYGDEQLELSTTLNLIKDFKFPSQTKIIYISSGAVYGNSKFKKSEIDTPLPNTVYGKSKLIAEKELFSRFEGNLVSLRVGNVVDGNNPYGIFALLATALADRKLELFGNPIDCRDYVGISDVLLGLECLITLNDLPQVLNMGSGDSLDLRKISELLQNATGGDISISWKPRRAGDLAQNRLDVSKFTQLLGANPVTSEKLIQDFMRTFFKPSSGL
jgi:nucleoside-diphosphate-sugar epimerase